MAIKKQEFYEGAALHLLARRGHLDGLRFNPPFIVANARFSLFLKYSTAGRSPWGFTFTPSECDQLRQSAESARLIIGLVCGSDGVAALDFAEFVILANSPIAAFRIACYRKHRELYEVTGPNGILRRKIPPSRWTQLLENDD